MLNNTNTLPVPGSLVPACDLREELLSLYSDMHKDFYGFRPRFCGDWDVATFEAEIERVTLNCYEGPCGCYDCDMLSWPCEFPTEGEGWALVTDDTEAAQGRMLTQWGLDYWA